MTRQLRSPVLACLVLLSAAASLAGTAADAQGSYMQLKRHEPVWAVSAHGGFYDATGVIQGTVSEANLPQYGGRFVDGRPVNGTAKLRNLDGRLLYEDEYRNYRVALVDRLQRIDNYRSAAGAAGLSDFERDNLRIERADIVAELNNLDDSYRNRTPFAPGSRFAGLGQPFAPATLGTPAVYPYPLTAPMQSAQMTPSMKQALLNQGMSFLSRLGF